MIVGLWQTDRHAISFLAQAQSPWKTGQTRSPPELPVWSKAITTSFLVLTNLDFLDLGTSMKKLCLSQGSGVAFIGHWPRAIYLFDIKTDRLTDRQVGKHIFCLALAHRPHVTVCRWTVSKLSVNCICIFVSHFPSTNHTKH